MNEKILPIDCTDRVPESPSEFYSELVSRNHHFVSPSAQRRISELRVFVGGCGSGGGACVEPLARLGVRHFRLADNGAYELANFNRQRAFVENLGENKAQFHLGVLKKINPFVDAAAFLDGVTESNVRQLVEWADIVLDCVDVTTEDGMRAKLRLHEVAHALRKPVFSPLDLGFCQWGTSFDYRKKSPSAIRGRLERALAAKNPIKAMFEMFPVSSVPGHSLQLINDLINGSNIPASQLGCASDMLSCAIAAAVVRFAETGEVVRGWDINLESLAIPFWKRVRINLLAPLERLRLRSRLNALP